MLLLLLFGRSKARIKRIVSRAHHQNVFITFFGAASLTLDSSYFICVQVTFPSIYLLLMNMMVRLGLFCVLRSADNFSSWTISPIWNTPNPSVHCTSLHTQTNTKDAHIKRTKHRKTNKVFNFDFIIYLETTWYNLWSWSILLWMRLICAEVHTDTNVALYECASTLFNVQLLLCVVCWSVRTASNWHRETSELILWVYEEIVHCALN